MPRRTVLAAATCAVVTAGTLVAFAAPALAAPAASAPAAMVTPSAGPRTPANPDQQLTTGMMPPSSPDAQAAQEAARTAPARAPRAATAYLDGIDVASYQHGAPLTWSQVAASGQSFTYIKATESTTYTNPYEPGDAAGARAAGMLVGLYHFARPSLVNGSAAADAVAEADYFSRQVNTIAGAQLPPTLDLEVNGGLTPAQLVDWTSSFLTRVQGDTGRIPMIYTGPYFWNTSVQSSAFTRYPLWEAHYTTAASPQQFGGWTTWTLWQWSDGAYFSPPSINGISGPVDRDRFAGTMPMLQRVASDSAAGPIPDGTLIQLAGTSPVYVVAGQAPLYLSTWDSYPGSHQVRQVSSVGFDNLRSTPLDGTFLHSVQTQQVYQVVGGAPLYVSSWAPYGGGRPYVNISQATVDNAGQSGVWSHLSNRPADGTFLLTFEGGQVYQVVGGAPVYVTSWAPFGSRPYSVVNQATVDNAGQGGVWSHLLYRPADGTFVASFDTGQVYRIVGGAPVYVSDWSYFDGVQPYSTVNQAVIDNATFSGAMNGAWTHLRFFPADGTGLTDATTGAHYVTLVGKPVPTADTTRTYTTVGHSAILNAGKAWTVWWHLL